MRENWRSNPIGEAVSAVRLWQYGERYFDTVEPPPDVEHYELIALPVAEHDAREKELATLRALVDEAKLIILESTYYKGYGNHGQLSLPNANDICARIDAARRPK